MKKINIPFDEMLSNVPIEVREETALSFLIADRLATLINERGLTKKEFAAAIGSKPSEVTKWLSGQQNFTIRTLAKFSAFFGEPLIEVVKS